MQKRSVQRGRPAGTRTYESEPARAFGVAVREARTAQGLAQEVLAEQAGIARSHMGKIERGEHMPTLVLILRIAKGLGCSAAALMAATEAQLSEEENDAE
ncbi:MULTISPECIES: helix-turn-helix domain-containing protein [Pseudomonadota]|jgi:transcriptional regulator with XRE-family HTH domain|uniref:Helix-turn-helix domain-containing protein n=2 Tax=Burkholderia cepacia complex TaxID=87882 RepID=A0AAP2MRI6_9BURK|nr:MULTISPECIES: helix-turn-helix transcriptional regulator [Pseudomonadota]KIS47827.1 helix-turn-helix family protein [Burkholderia cepacia]MBG6480955.1 helix-turn-helix transcriptional regulator [Pseudomonas aeruginosa]MCO7639722.1 helix-turn-helix domain-containing protein [Pseudomonas sp. S 311-6]MBB1610727.1 transcriptional regulator [Pseudomonas sp. UMC76]MBB1637517.1 transcriptional regulator [Pseudomonas sp. UME83]